MTVTPSAADLLNSGIPGATFSNVGDTITGILIDEPEVAQQTSFGDNQPLFWANGAPRYQLIATIDTETAQDDDGNTNLRIYIKGRMLQALRAAVRRTGEKSVRPGGRLTVRYIGDIKPTGRAAFAAKDYEVTYVPPRSGNTTPTQTDILNDTPAAAPDRSKYDLTDLDAGQIAALRAAKLIP